MPQHHFDVIILGSSPAARIAGVLLAKSGKRVLTFGQPRPPIDLWSFGSLHLDNLLEQLGGKDRTVPAERVQLIAAAQRFEAQGAQPLAEELRREFPTTHGSLVEWLRRLEGLGRHLEQLLLKSGGAPWWDLAANFRLRARLFVTQPNGRRLHQPLSSQLQTLHDPAARHCLAALFSGLSLMPVASLSLAEAALLWNSVCHQVTITPVELEQLLEKRYHQFHGQTDELTRVQEVTAEGKVRFDQKKIYSSEVVIAADREGLALFPETVQAKAGIRPEAQPWRIGSIEPPPSRLLAERIILADPQPLRITLRREGGQTRGLVASPNFSVANSQEPDMRRYTQTLLPFSDFELQPPTTDSTSPPEWPRPGFPARLPALRPGKNLWLCSGQAVLPALGFTGDIMTGMAVASRLSRRVGR